MSTGTGTKKTRRVEVARIPPGVPLDGALAVMNGMAAAYPKHTLTLRNDDQTGGNLIIHDPDAEPDTEDGDEPKPAITVALGDEEPGDLLAYAMSVAAEDQETGLKMLTLGLAGMLANAGAANYLTFGVDHPEIGGYAVTIQRRGGRTPAERIAELEQQVAELTAAEAKE